MEESTVALAEVAELEPIDQATAASRHPALETWLIGAPTGPAWRLGLATAAEVHFTEGAGRAVVGPVEAAGQLLRALVASGVIGGDEVVTAPAGSWRAAGLDRREAWGSWIWMYHDAEVHPPLIAAEPADDVELVDLDLAQSGPEMVAVMTTAYPRASHLPGDPAAIWWQGARSRADGRLLGLVAASRALPQGAPQLCSLGVLPQCRGRGLGRALLIRAARTAQSTANATGQPRVSLGVFADHPATVELYHHLGFEPVIHFESCRLQDPGQ
ncbi:MAG: GNAT family N-acetyltransferase [Propionibacteriaceae bacterium]|jgi:GNAT superfamily N-acetyltransferase|nr:GNAT family N-acetyltransferase [Propionibacteriaceae bacterium]